MACYEVMQSTSFVNCGPKDASKKDKLSSSVEAAQFWMHVGANAVQLLDQFKKLAVMLHDYLYKPLKRDGTMCMADRSNYLQSLDKWIKEQNYIGKLHVALNNIVDSVPNVLGSRWICLASDLRTLQFNADQWITDQHVIDNLNAAIEAIINADFALLCNKYELTVYRNSGGIIQQVGVLMDFLRANECQEPKLEFGGYENITGIMYIQS